MSYARLLIIHPDPSAQALLRSMLYSTAGRVDEATSDREAVRMLERGGTDLVLAGADPTDPDALELVRYVRRKYPSVPVIVLFPTPSAERAREALLRGASSVLKFPLPATELRAAVAQALESSSVVRPLAVGAPVGAAAGSGTARLATAPLVRPQAAPERVSLADLMTPAAADGQPLLGHDPALRLALELATAVAQARTPVLVLGERGAGKSLLARLVHQFSPRREGPFIEVDCRALKDGHLERELFGAKNGFASPGDASRGAADRAGKWARAHGGTLLLDDVSALSPELQLRLLRLLQAQEPGTAAEAPAGTPDVRVIVTSAVDLAPLVAQGRFRADLQDRLGSVCLKLPSLRQRGGDLELLAQHFRARFARELNKEVAGFTSEAIALLREHTWPGNVRELAAAIERAVMLCRGPRITPAHLALADPAPQPGRARPHTPRPHVGVGIRPLKEALEEPERQLILQALEALNWNRQETARVLDINRTTLYKKMKKYGLLMEEAAWVN